MPWRAAFPAPERNDGCLRFGFFGQGHRHIGKMHHLRLERAENQALEPPKSTRPDDDLIRLGFRSDLDDGLRDEAVLRPRGNRPGERRGAGTRAD